MGCSFNYYIRIECIFYELSNILDWIIPSIIGIGYIGNSPIWKTSQAKKLEIGMWVEKEKKTTCTFPIYAYNAVNN